MVCLCDVSTSSHLHCTFTVDCQAAKVVVSVLLLSAGECAQIAERLKKAVGNAAQGKPLQGQAAAVLGQQAAPANPPGYEGDVEMQ